MSLPSHPQRLTRFHKCGSDYSHPPTIINPVSQVRVGLVVVQGNVPPCLNCLSGFNVLTNVSFTRAVFQLTSCSAIGVLPCFLPHSLTSRRAPDSASVPLSVPVLSGVSGKRQCTAHRVWQAVYLHRPAASCKYHQGQARLPRAALCGMGVWG